MSCAVLLVEDEFLIAMDLKSQLQAAGYPVLGPAANVEQGLALLDNGTVCAAILDMNLQGSTSFPIAQRLAQEGTPFMFLSGNDASRLLEEFSDRIVLRKPINYPELLRELKAMCEA